MRHRLSVVFSLFICLLCSAQADAQMTRGEILRKFYQITSLHESGKDEEAIALCEEITNAYPSYPDTYLRLAGIYDDAGEEEMAIVMYRKYISLEMDDNAIRDCAARLYELESKHDTQHYMEVEEKKEKATYISYNNSSANRSGNINTDFNSLFDISQLVLSAESSETRSELSGQSDMQLSLDGIMLESDAVNISKKIDGLSDIPEHTVQEVEELFTSKDISSGNADRCSIPYYFSPSSEIIEIISLLDNSPSIPEAPVSSLSATGIKGRWASSICDETNGHEFMIADISAAGTDLYIQFDNESGMFHEHDHQLLKTSWNKIRSIWSNDAHDCNVSELKSCQNTVSISGDQYVMSCSLSKKSNSDLTEFSRSLMKDIANVIPMGNVTEKLGGMLLNHLNRNKSNATYQSFVRFSFKVITDNVLSCEYKVTEQQNFNSSTRTVLLDHKNFYLYRVPDQYEVFQYTDKETETAINKAIYNRLEKESETNSEMLYPLAMMSYSKIGMNISNDAISLSRAISQMQLLADNGCQRAVAWLIPVYYNLSLDNRHYPLRSQRQHFRSLADTLLESVESKEIPFAFGLRADILASTDCDSEQIRELYMRGMEHGDSHSYYRMGELLCDEHEYEKSAECFNKAGSLGYADAYLQLALLYKNGRLGDSDPVRYANLLRQAISLGSINALQELSEAYMWGAGVRRSVEDALELRKMFYKYKANVWIPVLEEYGISLSQY